MNKPLKPITDQEAFKLRLKDMSGFEVMERCWKLYKKGEMTGQQMQKVCQMKTVLKNKGTQAKERETLDKQFP